MQKPRPRNYDEFLRDYSYSTPDTYNFAFDCLDAKANKTPGQKAMIHVDKNGKIQTFDFKYFSEESARLANALKKKGIQKGDRIMVILYRRVEFWTTMLALHKIGAVAVPSPFLLTAPDTVKFDPGK